MGGVRTPQLPSLSIPSLTGLLSEAFVSVFEYLSLPCPGPSSSSSSWPATLQTAAHWYFKMNPVTVKRRLPQIEVPRQQKQFLSEDTPLGSLFFSLDCLRDKGDCGFRSSAHLSHSSDLRSVYVGSPQEINLLPSSALFSPQIKIRAGLA